MDSVQCKYCLFHIYVQRMCKVHDWYIGKMEDWPMYMNANFYFGIAKDMKIAC